MWKSKNDADPLYAFCTTHGYSRASHVEFVTDMKVGTLIEQRMQRASGRQKLTREQIEDLVRNGLDNLRVIEPSATVVCNNITVEWARDSEYIEVPRRAVPEKELEGWFQIFSAAPMVKTSPGSCRLP